MTVEFARARIAKLRNDFCYSEKGRVYVGLNNKDNKVYDIEEPLNLVGIK